MRFKKQTKQVELKICVKPLLPSLKLQVVILYQNRVHEVLVGLKMVTKTLAQFLTHLYLPWCGGDALGKHDAENQTFV